MTRKWFLVEGASRNMSIAMTCTDTIYAITQFAQEPKWSAEKLNSSIENGKRFLEEFLIATESLYRRDVFAEPFMFSLADETAKYIAVRPRQLQVLTRKAISDLSDRFLSSETYTLLTSIIKITQQAAVNKCESIKPIIL